MENLRILILIIVCSLFSFIIYNAFLFYNNIDNIRYINKKYGEVGNVVSGDVIFIDERVEDNNSRELDVKKKWRCVKYKTNEWIQISSLGILTNTIDDMNKKFFDKNDCIFDMINLPYYIIHDPCIIPESYNCKFIKNNL